MIVLKASAVLLLAAFAIYLAVRCRRRRPARSRLVDANLADFAPQSSTKSARRKKIKMNKVPVPVDDTDDIAEADTNTRRKKIEKQLVLPVPTASPRGASTYRDEIDGEDHFELK